MRVRSILLLGLLFFLGGCASLTSGPVARFEVSPPVIYAGDQVRFDGSTSYSNQALISYGWSFSDGGTGYGKEVDHTFPLLVFTPSPSRPPTRPENTPP